MHQLALEFQRCNGLGRLTKAHLQGQGRYQLNGGGGGRGCGAGQRDAILPTASLQQKANPMESQSPPAHILRPANQPNFAESRAEEGALRHELPAWPAVNGTRDHDSHTIR